MDFFNLEDGNVLLMGFLVNLAIGWANTILLYKSANKFFVDDNIA